MLCCFFFCKQKTAYEMRISDWSSDVCAADLRPDGDHVSATRQRHPKHSVRCREGPRPRLGSPLAGSFSSRDEDCPSRLIHDVDPFTVQLEFSLMGLQIGRASCRERVCQYV